MRSTARALLAFLALGASLTGCDPTGPPEVMRPQTVVLLATPKILSDFDQPGPDIARFLDNYGALTSRAEETIVIFAVGNSEHVLNYRGTEFWSDSAEWARYIGLDPITDRKLRFHHIAAIVSEFRRVADSIGFPLKVFDQVDGGIEFVYEYWKQTRHPECTADQHDSFDIRAVLVPDTKLYATAPNGIPSGITCGKFLVDQMAVYVKDMGFDGMLYGNQLGTRGRWRPEDGPGWSDAEAQGIRDFLAYSKEKLEGRDLMWFDSYNNTQVERDRFSFPPDGYKHFDYLLAAGFSVITFRDRYLDNLRSKLALRSDTKVLATLDWVDPWYDYNAMDEYAVMSATLQDIAVAHRYEIDGVMFFANDEVGQPVPRERIEAFAQRFFR